MMGKFSLLFSAEIEHLFFPDRCCRHLELVPSVACHKLIAGTGLVIRNSAGGIYFFYDQNKKDALFLAADDPREPLHFLIKGYAKDPNFMNFTDFPTLNEETILYFDNRSVGTKDESTIILNKETYVSEKDQKEITVASIAASLSKQDWVRKPAFILDIFVNQDPDGILGEPLDVKPRRYKIRFKNRETYWKYFLLNDLAKDNLYIEDANKRIKFEKPCAAKLSRGKAVFTIRSSSPLPLVEISKEHFQLKAKKAGSDKILMKRLPVASADRLSSEVIKGRDAPVSEIFINC